MDKNYDFESALAGQNRVIINFQKIQLTEDEPRDVDLDFMTPLIRVGNPQSAGHGSVKVLTPNTKRHQV